MFGQLWYPQTIDGKEEWPVRRNVTVGVLAGPPSDFGADPKSFVDENVTCKTDICSSGFAGIDQPVSSGRAGRSKGTCTKRDIYRLREGSCCCGQGKQHKHNCEDLNFHRVFSCHLRMSDSLNAHLRLCSCAHRCSSCE